MLISKKDAKPEDHGDPSLPFDPNDEFFSFMNISSAPNLERPPQKSPAEPIMQHPQNAQAGDNPDVSDTLFESIVDEVSPRVVC